MYIYKYIHIYYLYYIYCIYKLYLYIYIYIYILSLQDGAARLFQWFSKNQMKCISKNQKIKNQIYIYIYLYLYIYIYVCVCVCVCVCGVCIKVNCAFNRILEKASRPDLSTQMKKISPFTN